MSEHMSDLANLQTRVLDELYAPVMTPGALDDLIAARPERISIYRDNLFFGLLDVLADLFEITRTVMGDEAFRVFARDYIRAHPQASGDRNLYGAGLGDFLAGHEDLAGQVWISELAQLEWLMHCAHHADDAEPLAFDQLLGDFSIGLHPSASLISVTHNVFALTQSFHAGTLIEFVLVAEPKTLLLWRDQTDSVLCRPLNDLEARFVSFFHPPSAQGTHLGDILSTLSANDLAPLQIFMGETVPAGLFIEASPQ